MDRRGSDPRLVYPVIDQLPGSFPGSQRRSQTQAADAPLNKVRYGVGIAWESAGGREVDIDLQCVVIDVNGVITDCAYYNNLKAARGITHSGDETAGKPDGLQEIVWTNLKKLQANVGLLLFVVAAYTGGTLNDVVNGNVHILEEKESCEFAVYSLSKCMATVKVVAAMFKDNCGGVGTWKLRRLNQVAENGHHFMDVLPLLSDTIRMFIPSAPKKQKVAFAMEKGGVLDLPMELGRITVGLGWDVDEGEVDLDVSAVLLDHQGRDIEAVFFGRLESEEHGIVHTGDNLTGEGDGDDEQIQVSLDRIGQKVQQVFFVVNIYTPHKTFREVAAPYCRVIDDSTGSELCKYALRDAGVESALIVSKIAREVGGRWSFHALGLPCRGRTYKDSLPHIRASFNVKTQSLMLRSGSTGELSNSGVSSPQAMARPPPTYTGSAWAVGAAPPPAPAKKCCCIVQ